MTLEELLREAAAKGITYLSVYPVPSQDGKVTYWNASASPSTNHFPSKGQGTDIIEAVTLALQGMHGAKKRTPPKKEVTATVTENVDHGADPIDMSEDKDRLDKIDDWLLKP